MGACWGTPEADSDAATSRGAASGAEVQDEWLVQERQEYDTELRHHLISHSTPHRVENTISAVAVFTARARLAQEVVAKRKADSGCESNVALHRSPSAESRHEEALRAQMSREEKIADGLKLLRQRVDHLSLIHI